MTPGSEVRTALLALGGNQGDVLSTFRGALARVADRIGDVTVSAVYRTPPEGGADQAPYLNAAARVCTELGPRALLSVTSDVERAGGRTRPHAGAPRTLDVDILFLGSLVMESPELTIPHPRWAARDFVVVPLLDVAPDWIDPTTGRSVREVAERRGWTGARFPVVAQAGELDVVGSRGHA